MMGDGAIGVFGMVVCALFCLVLWIVPAIIVMVTAPPPPGYVPPGKPLT